MGYHFDPVFETPAAFLEGEDLHEFAMESGIPLEHFDGFEPVPETPEVEEPANEEPANEVPFVEDFVPFSTPSPPPAIPRRR